MRKSFAGTLFVVSTTLASPAAAQGWSPPEGASLWPAWQARLSLTTAAGSGLRLQLPGRDHTVRQASLLGDYFLLRHGLAMAPGWRGGLRATGGLVLGRLAPAAATTDAPWSVSLLAADSAGDAPADTTFWPYLGIGYAGLSARSGWGVSADLGFIGRPAGSGGWRPARLGSGSLDDLGFSPMLRFDVNYAF